MSEAVTKTATICNERGLHARAAARFCEIAQTFNARISVSKDGMTVNGCSLMALLMLGAGIGTTIELSATGQDADLALTALTALVEDRFGEPV